MSKENNPLYGAIIERGVILTEESGAYTVQSFDRENVVTPPITALSDSYDVGNRVFFFLFNDGSGRILGLMDD